MIPNRFVFWEVDTQADFMLPGGKLYVSGAERLLPNIRRLTDAARRGRVFLVSHGCFHSAADPEFQTFPPHCVKGTPGAEYVSEGLTDKVCRLPNQSDVTLPVDLFSYQQILLEKQTLDVFESRFADDLVKRFPRDIVFVLFGVVTEFCVRFASVGLLSRGRKVLIVRDAIETLRREDGDRTLAELKSLGATLITTDEALALVEDGIHAPATDL